MFPLIFHETLLNFERRGKNIRKIWKTYILAKYHEKIFLNSKKPVGGVCASQDWSQKIPLAKIIFFL